MALIVQKYGGTSVASLDRIRQVARRVIETKAQGHQLIVVASAMAGETDNLLSLARRIAERPDEREMDVLLSTGEQVSVALLALAIKALGDRARSFLGHQVRIFTDSAFGRARILSVDSERLHEALKDDSVVVVAGFQGADRAGNITTLGRGGSDTTAVAIAAAVRADSCEIYTDVEGVYTADPNLCPDARKLERISYDEMLEMASAGAKVLQTRSVEFAKKYGVPLHVRSSFSRAEGTLVTEEEPSMEDVVVSGVTCDRDEAKITVTRVADRPGLAARLFGPIAEAGIVVDMIVQNVSADEYTDMTFTVTRADFRKAMELVRRTAAQIGAGEVTGDEHIAKVSIVGVGMRSHAGVASRMFAALAREGINIMMISTSEIKISCVIEEKYTELAVRVLHDAFGLGRGPARRRSRPARRARGR
ncbi:MAG: aspartate kinase [Deltaproteobacteria bacterium]|nr:aspartate kinase [Deltaproteobacteria bacterium]